MSTANLPSLSHPDFPQVFTKAIDWMIERTERCEFDHYLCGAKATVTDLESERRFCGKHFREVSRG